VSIYAKIAFFHFFAKNHPGRLQLPRGQLLWFPVYFLGMWSWHKHDSPPAALKGKKGKMIQQVLEMLVFLVS
jgi:hypothetical protein